ncbi:hypothetical protein FQN52_009018 [Onygenales sp. PD_12]|nr:hypothetical protein FQN52_009018 [Onygenales sp. PD_12]
MGRCDFDKNADDIGWLFCPSFEAAVLFTVLFGLTTIFHIVQWVNFRKKFCWVITMSCIWETAGFALRSVSAQKIIGLWHFIPQQLLIILAPLWLNAFVYMVLGRMIHFFIPEKKIFGISARRLTLIFVLLDIVAFLVQGSSSSLMSSDDLKMVDIGIKIYMGGIALQQLFILLFFILASRFQQQMTHLEQHTTHNTTITTHPWRRLLYALYATLLLITLRIIFRLVEFSGGLESKIATSEAAFYVLDAVPMIVALVLLNVVHPGLVLVGAESEFPKKEGKKGKGKGDGGKKRRWGGRRGTLSELESASDLETEALQLRDGNGNGNGNGNGDFGRESSVSPGPPPLPADAGTGTGTGGYQHLPL